MLDRFSDCFRPYLCLIALTGSVIALGDRLFAEEDEHAAPAGAKDAARQENQAEAPSPDGPNGKDQRQRVGTLIRLNQPITDQIDRRVHRAADEAIRKAKANGHWPVIVFEISSGESKFGQAYDLARYLSGPRLNGATTVAYLPQTLSGHAVLVALACDEIIMGDEAQLGDAGRGEDIVKPSVRNAYVEVANSRKTVPADVALKMLDPSIDLRLVETEVSREFVRADRLRQVRKHKSVAKETPLIAAGKPGIFSGQRARELGFVSFLANDRQEVAKALGLQNGVLEEDLALSGDIRPVRIDIKGPISAALTEQIQNIVQTQIRDDANLLCLWIDSPGGAPNESINLANFLSTLDADERRTVAYIPSEARGDAAFIALACDQIVMRPRAVLGGSGAAVMEDGEMEAIASSLAAIAAGKHHSPALAGALVEARETVYRYTRPADGLNEYLTEEQAAKLPDAKAWQRGSAVIEQGKTLQLNGEQAEELGLAHAVVDDFQGLKTLYGLERDMRMVEPNWADFLIQALNSPGISVFLLLLGGAALYAELQSPGIGLGGLIAAICFLLYFWSAYLGGTAGWLEVLLFVVGLICLALEIFVLPGFGLFGLAGGLLVISSLILASQTFVLPRNEYQFDHLRRSLLVLTGAGAGVIVSAALMRRYLPHAPMFSNMVLAPPSNEELSRLNERESLARQEHLLGRRGVAFTPLVPSGKARFDDELVDVLTDGEFVDRGLPVEVVEVRGNRVVVRGLS